MEGYIAGKDVAGLESKVTFLLAQVKAQQAALLGNAEALEKLGEKLNLEYDQTKKDWTKTIDVDAEKDKRKKKDG